MHELAITRSLLDIVLTRAQEGNATRVLTVRLKIGELRDIVNELMQKCFNYLARDTVAANAELIIDRIPLTVKCKDCNSISPLNIKSEFEKTVCPKCGGHKFEIESGQEFFIEDIEVI